jgi:hypothetical protein
MNPDEMTETDYRNAGDLEQMQQEDALWPWLADDSMADCEDYEIVSECETDW